MRRVSRVIGTAWLVLAGAGFAVAQEGAAERAQRLMHTLVAAYPDFLERTEGNDVVWKDGTRMPFDDGTGEKDFETRLDRPDLEDMFYVPYPLGRAGTPPAFNSDPGRVRFQPFYAKMYGDCTKGEAAQHLVDVIWLPSKSGQRLKVSRINGVAEKLQAVSNELEKLPSAMTRFLVPSAGTYNCRVVAGTTRTSAHGLGIAIDIAVAQSDYWYWAKPGRDARHAYRNRVPWEIVEAFEKHGFIWGGKWYHYDTMQFEYRPEIIGASK
jgi:D-alanyl-D-alanine carboxypeptidase